VRMSRRKRRKRKEKRRPMSSRRNMMVTKRMRPNGEEIGGKHSNFHGTFPILSNFLAFVAIFPILLNFQAFELHFSNPNIPFQSNFAFSSIHFPINAFNFLKKSCARMV
jgi:hypothetical protein